MDTLPPDAIRCFVFQYVVFAVVIGLGLVLLWRQGDVGLSSPRRRRNLALIGGGYFVFLFLHGFLQFVASRW